MLRDILSDLSILVGIYFLYIIITAVILFYFQEPHFTSMDIETGQEMGMESFVSEGTSQDRVVLVQDRFESGLARIHLVDSAEENLDISYYSVIDGVVSDLFLSSIVEAGDRGVQVRIVLDGLVNLFNRDIRKAIYVFTQHPNIEFQYYEPFKPLKPWTWHHRFHDKLILVDDELAMIGGRNIGDKYFGPEGYEGASNDRDVVIINTAMEKTEKSVLQEMKDYYNQVWDHEFTETPYTSLSKRQQKIADKREEELQAALKQVKEERPELFDFDFDWMKHSFPVNQITFIHNPHERFNSEPWIWQDLVGLMEEAEESIYMESPYVIPTKKMKAYVDEDAVKVPEMSLYTNSLASTPNLFAFSGYTNYRDEIAQSGIQLYEFQSQTESVHAKTAIFDERLSAIGSFNLDPRSAFLNTEVMVIIDSKEFAHHLLKKNIALRKQESLKVDDDGSYMDSSELVPADVSWTKKIVNTIFSKLARFIEFLL